VADYQRNLVIVHSVGLQARSDFESVQETMAVRAPDIEVFIVNNRAPHSVTRRQAARRPTLVFSPVALHEFRPLRGKVYAGRWHTKMEEIRRLAEAGVNVPEAVMLEPETKLEPEAWGPFTVVKPNLGRQGAGIRLHRTRDVRWADPQSWPRDDPRFGVPLVAQKFVDTGPFSESHRVMTVFGRAIYSIMSRSSDARPFDLDALGDDRLDQPVASNSGERTLELNFERDVIDFGKEVARAFPEIPVLGVDIVREQATGRLYALEVNARGMTWHISSNYGLVHQRKYGLDLHGQFGAIDVLADALIDVTRREAE